MALIHPAYRCIYHHYPRTGGSSLRRVLGVCSEWPRGHSSVATFNATLQAARNSKETGLGRIGRISLEVYKQFGTLRNPYEVMVSMYETMMDQPQNGDLHSMSFRDWVVEAWVKKAFSVERFQGFEWQTYMEFWNVPKSRDMIQIFRFEEPGHWNQIFDFLQEPVLPRPHVGAARHRKPKEAYYTRETADMITKVFEKDLEYFNYERYTP